MDTLADPRSEVNHSLAVEVLRRFGEARLRLMGASMLCAMWPGDLVAVRRQGIGEIRRGHVVLFVREGRLFAHRVVGKIRRQDRTLLVTRGDRLKENGPPVSPGGAAGSRYRRHFRLQVSGPAYHGRAPHRVLALVPLGAGYTDGAAAWLPVAIHVGRTCTPRVQASRRGALAGPLPAIGTLRRPLSTAPMPIPPIPQPCGRRP